MHSSGLIYLLNIVLFLCTVQKIVKDDIVEFSNYSAPRNAVL